MARAEVRRAGPALVLLGVPLGTGIALAAAFMMWLPGDPPKSAAIQPGVALSLTLSMSPMIAMMGVICGAVALPIVLLPLWRKPLVAGIALTYGPALVIAVATAPFVGPFSALSAMVVLVVASILVGFFLPDVPPAGEVMAIDADSTVPA